MDERQKINDLFIKKYGENYQTEKLVDLIDLFDLIQKFGLNTVKEIYPPKLFDTNLEFLVEARVFENSSARNTIQKPVFNNEINMLNPLNIDWIRYFVIFGEIGNTSDAARYLNISSQALLKAISGIETHYNIKLVERGKHFKGLTPTGQLFLENCRLLLLNLNDLDKKFSNVKSPFSGSVRIGYTGLWRGEIISKLIPDFIKKFPEVSFRLYSIPFLEIGKWLSSGEIDIGLVGSIPKSPDINYIDLEKCSFIIVGKPQSKKHYNQFSYIVPGTLDLKMEAILNIWFKKNFIDCKIILNIDNFQMALELCEQGVGVCLVPELSVKERIKSGSLAIIAEPPAEFHENTLVIWNKKYYISQLTSEFIKEIINTFKT